MAITLSNSDPLVASLCAVVAVPQYKEREGPGAGVIGGGVEEMGGAVGCGGAGGDMAG